MAEPKSSTVAISDVTLGLALRRVRVRRGWTQATVAHRLALGRDAVLAAEAGRRKVSAVELYQWAAVLGTTPGRVYAAALACELALAFVLLASPRQVELGFADTTEECS